MKLNISEKQFDSQFLDKAVDKILAYKPGENQGHGGKPGTHPVFLDNKECRAQIPEHRQ